MKNIVRYLPCFAFSVLVFLLSHSGALSQSVLVSEYYNDQPTSEWNEIIVVTDNLDMRGFVVSDNNTAQVTRQGGVKFKNIDFWKNVRAGTIIGIWHRDYPTNDINARDTSIADGRLMLAKTDAAFFEEYKSSTSIQPDAPFNLAIDGDIIEVLDASGKHIHGCGHRTVDPAPGTYWLAMDPPKLNNAVSLQNGQSNRVFPGSKLSEYNGAHGTPLTQACAANITRTLPNKDCNSAASNWAFWHELRIPQWNTPTLTPTVSATQVTLNWNGMTDLNPGDKMQGYMVLRDSGSSPSLPVDGRSYLNGDKIGNAVVLAHLNANQTSYTDNVSIPCGALYTYRIYAFRFSQDDEFGNGASPQTTRGRQYNTKDVASSQVIKPAPQGPKLQAQSATAFCSGGSVVISVPTQTGLQPQWMLNGGDIAGEVSFSTTAKVGGEYRLKLRDANGCLVLTDSVIVTIHPLPIVDIAPRTYNLCKDSTAVLFATDVAGYTYQWFKDGQPVSGAVQPTYTATASGSYTVTVTDAKGCINTSPASVISPISASFNLSLSTIKYRDLAGCENTLDSAISISNPGTQSVTIEQIQEPSGFRVVSPATPFEVKPGESRTVIIRFAPEIQGTATGTMNFIASPCGANKSLQLSGSKPDIVGVRSLSTAVDFGTLISCQSKQRLDSIIIIYSSDNNAFLDKPIFTAPQPFEVDESLTTFPVTLRKDSLQKIYIRFTAQADVPVSRDLKIPYRTQSCSDTLRITVRGSMTTPNVESTPLDLKFPPLDSCSVLERDTTIILRNTSSVDITINQLSQPYLQIVKPLPNPTISIKARDSVVLTLRFSLQGYSSVNNFLQFTGAPCLNSSLMQISGERRGATFAVKATELDFGDIVRCNSSQISRSFDVITTTTTPGLAHVGDIHFSASGYSLNLTRFQPMADSTHVIVTLNPDASAALGSFTDTLDLLFDPCDVARRIILKGRYLQPDVAVSPTFTTKQESLLFGTIDAKSTVSKTSTIRNTGSTPLQTATLLNNLLPPFSATAVPPLGSVLQPGDSMVITIVYAPQFASKDHVISTLAIVAPCADTITLTLDAEARRLDVPTRPFFLSVDNGYRGKPGDKISVKVNISGADISDADLRSLEAVLTFNKSMLYPLSIRTGNALQTHTASFTKVGTGIKLRADGGNKVSAEGEAFIVDMEVLLGDALQTPLALDTNTIQLLSDVLVRGSVQSGTFTVEGVCDIGKRLLKVEGKVALNLLNANPVRERADISYETVGEQQTSVEIFNSVGERVQVVYDGISNAGIHTTEVPVSLFSQGAYFLVLRNGIHTKTLRFDIIR